MIDANSTDREPWQCPVDNARLTLIQTHAGGIGACPSCRGLWMSSEAIERASEIVDRIPSASRHRGPRVDVPEEKERDCSNCGEQMRGVVVEGVAIDVCPQCRGVWLDRGEFDVVWQWFGMPLDEEASGQRQKSDGDAIASETLMTLVETILVATSLFH